MKISLEDYKTESFSLDVDGVNGVVVVASLASREWVDGLSRYQSAIAYAKENDIALTEEKEVDLGFDNLTRTETVKTEFHNKAWAKAMQSLVKEWPFEADLFDALMESPELSGKIDLVASRLKAEFESLKKI